MKLVIVVIWILLFILSFFDSLWIMYKKDFNLRYLCICLWILEYELIVKVYIIVYCFVMIVFLFILILFCYFLIFKVLKWDLLDLVVDEVEKNSMKRFLKFFVFLVVVFCVFCLLFVCFFMYVIVIIDV